MAILKKKTCPRCSKSYTDYPAKSRLDNKTDICPPCGTHEALLQISLKSHGFSRDEILAMLWYWFDDKERLHYKPDDYLMDDIEHYFDGKLGETVELSKSFIRSNGILNPKGAAGEV